MGSCNAMAVGHESEARIAKLLHDSYIAAAGAEIAREVGDKPAYERLKRKSANLYHQARIIDPAQNAAAWRD